MYGFSGSAAFDHHQRSDRHVHFVESAAGRLRRVHLRAEHARGKDSLAAFSRQQALLDAHRVSPGCLRYRVLRPDDDGTHRIEPAAGGQTCRVALLSDGARGHLRGCSDLGSALDQRPGLVVGYGQSRIGAHCWCPLHRFDCKRAHHGASLPIGALCFVAPPAVGEDARSACLLEPPGRRRHR